MDPEKDMLKAKNRREYIYRQLSFIAGHGDSDSARVGALNLMDKINNKNEAIASGTFDAGVGKITINVEMWRAKDADPTE